MEMGKTQILLVTGPFLSQKRGSRARMRMKKSVFTYLRVFLSESTMPVVQFRKDIT